MRLLNAINEGNAHCRFGRGLEGMLGCGIAIGSDGCCLLGYDGGLLILGRMGMSFALLL